MKSKFTALVIVTALAAMLGATTTASAGWRHGPGWGGPGWGRPGWGPGWGRPGWGGAGWGGAMAAGVIGGMAVGAIAASAATPACYLTNQPVLDAWGEVVGYRRVQVCQ